MHERAGHQHHRQRRVGVDASHQLIDVGRGRSTGNGVAARTEHVEQIVLAPHHTLGHTGGAAGVEQQQVVAAAPPTNRRRLGATGDHCFVRRGPFGAAARFVGHHVPAADLAQVGANLLDHVGETGVEHHSLGVGVVEQVGHLIGAVPIVRIHRCHGHLERGHHRFEVLGAVVEVTGNLALMPQSGGHEVGGERIGTSIELAPGDHAVADDLTRMVRHSPSHRLENVGKVPIGHRGSGISHRRPPLQRSMARCANPDRTKQR